MTSRYYSFFCFFCLFLALYILLIDLCKLFWWQLQKDYFHQNLNTTQVLSLKWLSLEAGLLACPLQWNFWIRGMRCKDEVPFAFSLLWKFSNIYYQLVASDTICMCFMLYAYYYGTITGIALLSVSYKDLVLPFSYKNLSWFRFLWYVCMVLEHTWICNLWLMVHMQVDIYESRPFIGGKVGSFVDKQGNHIEMGLHVFFGCYNNLFRLMKKVKPPLFLLLIYISQSSEFIVVAHLSWSFPTNRIFYIKFYANLFVSNTLKKSTLSVYTH